MRTIDLNSKHKPVQSYYAAVRQFDDLDVSHKGAVESALHLSPPDPSIVLPT
jgi:hypothetical protein